MKDLIIEAIRERNRIWFLHDAKSQIVEPHVLGVPRHYESDELALEGFRTEGGPAGWRVYDLSRIREIVILEEKFEVQEDFLNLPDRWNSIIASVALTS